MPAWLWVVIAVECLTAVALAWVIARLARPRGGVFWRALLVLGTGAVVSSLLLVVGWRIWRGGFAAVTAG